GSAAWVRVACGLALAWGLAGCGSSEERSLADAPEEPRYALVGEVVAVDPARPVLVVRHEEIPGYMPAMTMEFGVQAGDWANARPGQRIRAQLVPSDTGDFRLEKLWPAVPGDEARISAASQALQQDTAIRGRRAYREVGEALPDFGLYNQAGEVVTAQQFRGKQVMLNFIFTRCPVATMCPAATT